MSGNDAELILIGGGLLAAGILGALLAERMRIPGLLLFLGLGMLAGSEGIGGIEFEDAELARTLGTIAAPTIIPSSRLRSKIQGRERRRCPAVTTVPTVASETAVPSTGRISDQPAVSPPSKRIRTRRDRAQGPGQLGVVELDAADPLRAGQHAEPEEEQQARDADALGEQRADDPGREQGAGDEDQLGVVSAHRGPADLAVLVDCARARSSSSSAEPGAGMSSARSCGWR